MLKKKYFVCLQAENSNVGTSHQAESSNTGTSRRQGDCESGSPSSKRRKVPQVEIFPRFLKQIFFFKLSLLLLYPLPLYAHSARKHVFELQNRRTAFLDAGGVINHGRSVRKSSSIVNNV